MSAKNTRRWGGLVTAATAVILTCAGIAQASPTTPDPEQTQIGGTTVRPHAVVATPDGKIYVAEFGYFIQEDQADGNYQRRVVVYEPNGAGVYPAQPRTVAGTGAACLTSESAAACGEGGPATAARLGHVSGLAVDAAGRVYLAENFWARVRVVGTDGNIRTVQGAPGGLNTPEGLAYDATTNTILVTDKRNDRLLSFPATNGGPTTWRTVAGQDSKGGDPSTGARCPAPTDPCGDGGPATSARLLQPGAVAVDEAGTIYLADSGALRVRKIVRGGAITRFAGDGNVCAEADPCGDGGPAVNARFGDPATPGADGEGPFGIATSDGAVYIADSDINKIRRVLPNGTIETIATVDHPKAPYALRTPAGHDLVIPAWDDNLVTRLRGIDRFDLTVAKDGTGTGTVTGAGIACGTDCTEAAGGSQVTLTATAAAGSSFSGWSGATCTGTGPCPVTVNASRTVTATFTLNPAAAAVSRTLTASVTGAGTVTGGGLTCGTACSASHPAGTTVTLTAAPAAGQRFVGWTGACATASGASCTLTLTGDASVGAVFEPIPAVVGPGAQPAIPAAPAAPSVPGTTPPPAASLRLTSSVLGSRTVARGRSVRLRYRLTARATLTLEVRPARGRVQRIALGRRNAGTGTVTWNGRLRGRAVAGRYTLVLVAKAGTVTKRASVRVTVRR